MTIAFTTDDTEKRDKLLAEWETSKELLIAAKDREMALRKLVTDMCFPNPVKGTQRIDLYNGWCLKLVYGTNYTLEKDKNKLNDALEAIDSLDDEKVVTARLIKWVPELVEKEYLTLPKMFKEIADVIITSKPKAPAIELEAPKEK